MTQDEMNAILSGLLQDKVTPADIANAVNLIKTDYAAMIAAKEKAEEEKAYAVSEATKYAKLNNELYLQLGVGKLEDTPTESEPEAEPPKKMEYEDLNFLN